MKVELVYPKIPDTNHCPLKKCIAFEKLDGTNIHFVFENSKFSKFGTRRDRFNFNDEGINEFGYVHPELSSLVDDNLDFIKSVESLVSSKSNGMVFFEYLGRNSFAGQHLPEDDKKLFIIDCVIDGQLIFPEDFIKYFKEFEDKLPKVVYRGKYSGQLLVDVRRGLYNVKEGVVIKGVVNQKVYMAKIKTDEYMKRIQSAFKDNWKQYWE